MASPKNKLNKKDVELLNHKYNGAAYKKPRKMNPRNMDKKSSDSFNEGHIKKVHNSKPSRSKK